jgi:DNA sulfur modification protein DndD
LPDRLETDLEVLVARKRKQLAQGQDLQQLEAIETALEKLQADHKAAHQTKARLQNELDRAQMQLEQAQETFLAEGGKIAAEKAELEAKLTRLGADLDQSQTHLRDLAAGALPLALVADLLRQAQP